MYILMISIDYYIYVFVWLGLIIMQVINFMVYAQYKLQFKKKHYLQMRSFTKTAFVNVIYLFTNAFIYQNRICKCDLRMQFLPRPHS